MREILFRGKRTDGTGWIEGFYFQKPNPRSEDGQPVYHGITDLPPFCAEVIPETVGQYTGLKDKNGKQIFEGDIIKAKIEGGNHEGFTWPNMPVDFQQGAFCLNDQNGRVFCVLGAFAPSVSFEVIGNIHDNKELLHDCEV